MSHPRGHKGSHDCSKCKISQEARENWGCDQPSKTRQMIVDGFPCEECGGGSERRGCPVCRGSGTLTLYRCPRSVVPPSFFGLLRLICIAKDGGPWPEAGGLLDQTASFVDAYDLALAELARIESEDR